MARKVLLVCGIASSLLYVEELWDSAEGSAESDELDIVTTLVEAYEREHYPVDLPNPLMPSSFGSSKGVRTSVP